MKKGFTLMEMIVTMLLIGIVITVVIPSVRNLTYNSGSKKYKQMEKVIIEASKLYAASYQGELTNTSYECFNIPYSTLVKEELIEEEDITCSGQIILRKREKVGYNYEPYLTCTDSKEKVVHEEKRPASLVNCIGFSGNFKVEYALYNDEGYSNSYTIGNWEKYVYGKYSSVSPYGTGIEKYQYTKDLLNWIDMTGNTEDYTNFNGTIYIRAIDQDGNISSVAHHLIRTDTTGPSYALTNNEHQITEDNKMLISISNLKDSGVGVDASDNIYSFDGGITWVNRTSQEFALATTGEVQVKDKLANVTTQPLSVIKACSGGEANATADKILTGNSAWVNGTLIKGSMANNGAVTKTLNPGDSYTIPKGFHNGSGQITVSSLASNTNGTATAGQILTGQTAWVNGSKITGTMKNMGKLNLNPTERTTYTVEPGYYSGGTIDTSGVYNAGYNEGYKIANNSNFKVKKMTISCPDTISVNLGGRPKFLIHSVYPHAPFIYVADTNGNTIFNGLMGYVTLTDTGYKYTSLGSWGTQTATVIYSLEGINVE